MAKVSQITVPNGTTYDIGVKYPNVSPILSKTFTGVIATEANWTNGVFFFGSIKPVSWNGLWSIKYKVYAEAAGQPLSQAKATVTIAGNQDVYRTYASYNEFANADYRPCYYHELYRMKKAGFDNGYGHSIGLRLYSSWNSTTAANARTITIEIYECYNCTFEFYDSMLKYAGIPGTGSTNYNTYSELDFANNGLQETGDANDVNYYNREYYPSRKVYAALYRYQFLLTRDYEHLLPTNSVNNSTATTKAMTTEEFDPFGEIYYWSSTGTASAGGNMPNGYLYRQYLADLRYAFNYAQGTFTARKPVYLVCTPQENGMAKLYSEPLTQTLPTTADGRMYIYLGTMYEDTSPYRVNLSLHHEVLMYIDGEVRAVGPHALTAGDAATVNGHTVAKDVPSDAVFTDNNNAVTQTATTTSANYEVLFSATADNTTRTEGARKNSNITFNPSTGNLNVTQINGVTVGSSPKFTDNNTTYSAGTGLSLSSTTFNHSNSVTAGTAGTSSATSGSTLAVPYVTYDAQGHVTASGTHTHTVSGFLTSHQTIKQDGVTGATVNRYGACTTAAGTAAKTVSVTTGTFSLEAGARVSVKFDNANTANSPTLNVNSKGAKNIFHKGAQITSGANKALLAGICDFIYDGTQWHLVGNYIDTDNNTTYGLSISGHTVSIVAGGTTTSVTVPDNNTTYTANNENIGSASAGTAIPADDITAWSAGTMFSASASEGVVTFTAGTAPSLSYTAKSIPNISVTTKSVTTSITAS